MTMHAHMTTATSLMTPTAKRRARRRRAQRIKPRRRSLARLRSEFFARAGESATRYAITFEHVLRHLWAARRVNARLTLRHVTNLADLVQAIACLRGEGRAWADLSEQYERALVRRGQNTPDDLEATVQARRFIAALRRDALANHCALERYCGTRPLRTWLADVFSIARQRSRRAAFVLDPADSCCGAPLRFTRAQG